MILTLSIFNTKSLYNLKWQFRTIKVGEKTPVSSIHHHPMPEMVIGRNGEDIDNL